MVIASTNAEKRQRIAEALHEDPHRNNTDLARLLGSNWNMVARVRRELEASGTIPAVKFANGGQNKLPENSQEFSPGNMTDEAIQAYALQQARRMRTKFLFKITAVSNEHDWFWYALPDQRIVRHRMPRDWRGR